MKISVAVLIVLMYVVTCIQSWRELKHRHPCKQVLTKAGLTQITEDLADEKHFIQSLDAILIPRLVGSETMPWLGSTLYGS